MLCFEKLDFETPTRSLERAIHQYENACALLNQESRQKLKSRAAQRERTISLQLESATERFRERGQELERSTDEREREDLGNLLRQEIAALRQHSIGIASSEAEDGIREFADGLLFSQGRLGVHASRLRAYTALLVGAIRERLHRSQFFQLEPLLPWPQDPIAQKAIQTCEETIAERRKLDDYWLYDKAELKESSPRRTWPPIVQDWEMFKADQNISPGSEERIPESFLRTILSTDYGTSPQDVTFQQIRMAAADLCRHYGFF